LLKVVSEQLEEKTFYEKNKKAHETYKSMLGVDIKESLDVPRVDKVVIISLHLYSGTCMRCTMHINRDS